MGLYNILVLFYELVRMRRKLDWLGRLEGDVGKDISKAFFIEYTTQTEVSKLVFPKHHKRLRRKKVLDKPQSTVHSYFHEWQDLGFFNGDHKGKRFRLNLGPIFKFADEKKIKFTLKEKNILQTLFENKFVRAKALLTYPGGDIARACILFYIREFILAKLYRSGPVVKIPKASKLRKILSSSDQNFREAAMNFNFENVYAIYFWHKRKYPKVLSSIDKKILRCADLLP